MGSSSSGFDSSKSESSVNGVPGQDGESGASKVGDSEYGGSADSVSTAEIPVLVAPVLVDSFQLYHVGRSRVDSEIIEEFVKEGLLNLLSLLVLPVRRKFRLRNLMKPWFFRTF